MMKFSNMKKIFILVATLLSSFNLQAQLKVTLPFIATSDSLCLNVQGNGLQFFDHQYYLLIENNLTERRYIYWKDKAKCVPILIDSEWVKTVYVDFLKAPQQYQDYMSVADKAQLKPKVASLCAYDDSTVLGSFITYRSDTILEDNRIIVEYTPVHSILEIGKNKPIKQFFVNDSLPIASYSLGSNIYAYKKVLYCKILADMDEISPSSFNLKMLVRMKRPTGSFRADKVLPHVIDDYLITNEIYYNYNRFYFDNGYSLMSLSNYIEHIETGEKVYLPIADSVFRNVRIDPQTMLINYLVFDFKYNKKEQKFYIRYNLNRKCYVASFKAHTKQFDTNELVYAADSDFGWDMKNDCLSWDGKRVIYSMKGENCFHYVSIPELQRRAREYKRRAGQ